TTGQAVARQQAADGAAEAQEQHGQSEVDAEPLALLGRFVHQALVFFKQASARIDDGIDGTGAVEGLKVLAWSLLFHLPGHFAKAGSVSSEALGDLIDIGLFARCERALPGTLQSVLEVALVSLDMLPARLVGGNEIQEAAIAELTSSDFELLGGL